MYNAMLAKFSSEPLKKLLLDTKDSKIEFEFKGSKDFWSVANEICLTKVRTKLCSKELI